MHILRILELEGAFEVACSSSFALVMGGSVAWREGIFLRSQAKFHPLIFTSVHPPFLPLLFRKEGSFV